MEAITYRLDRFEGPLDLLLTLIHKNKVNIEDIPISLICDQYMEYIAAAQEMDMDVASEFLVMASDLMLIKSKLLLPRPEEEAEDPRKELKDALLRYEQAKRAASLMHPLYALYSSRFVKDTDEISVDRTFVDDQDPERLYLAMRRIVDLNDAMEEAHRNAFTTMIAKPIVPVEHKILQIMTRLSSSRYQKLSDFLDDSVSLPDMIAIFIGVLELVKTGRILLVENDIPPEDNSYGTDTVFTLNESYTPPRESNDNDENNDNDKETQR